MIDLKMVRIEIVINAAQCQNSCRFYFHMRYSDRLFLSKSKRLRQCLNCYRVYGTNATKEFFLLLFIGDDAKVFKKRSNLQYCIEQYFKIIRSVAIVI